MINEANKELAHTAVKNYQELIGKLITKEIKKSPLHFRRDPDLKFQIVNLRKTCRMNSEEIIE